MDDLALQLFSHCPVYVFMSQRFSSECETESADSEICTPKLTIVRLVKPVQRESCEQSQVWADELFI